MPAVARFDHLALRAVHFSPWLNGLIGCLAVTALGVALIFPAVLGATEGDATSVAVALAYPLGDCLTLFFVVLAWTLLGWKPGRQWLLIGFSFVSTALADAIYAHQTALAYNDSFSHSAGGDALLARLGAELDQVVSDHGRACRLGAASSACSSTPPSRVTHPWIVRAATAFSERGEQFAISASGWRPGSSRSATPSTPCASSARTTSR